MPGSRRLPSFQVLLLLTNLVLFLPSLALANKTIVGGEDTDIAAWPSTVALLTRGQPDSLSSQFCGGTLIAPRWVLTAAHCVTDETAATVDAVTGRSNMNTSAGQRIPVQTLFIYPHYNSSTKDGDLALLYLSSASTQPVMSVIPQNDPAGLAADGTNGYVVGWGNTTDGGQKSAQLQKLGLPILATATANQADWLNGAVTDNQFAAGYAAGGKDACQSDSGGPYMVPTQPSGGWVLAGVVSWGYGCAQPKNPGVYARLSKYQTWIAAAMRRAGAIPTSPLLLLKKKS